MAVWALRVGYLGLAVIVADLVAMLAESTPWVLVAGVFIWLAAVVVTLTGFPQRRDGTD
jgi:membrane protein YdbS with pleckstrin-like domain